MKLQALDQIHISSVKSDTLRKGEEFECSESLGEELIKKHPYLFRVIGIAAPLVGMGGKAEPPLQNKAEKRFSKKASSKPMPASSLAVSASDAPDAGAEIDTV